jgi:glucose-6-phosphate isomerase
VTQADIKLYYKNATSEALGKEHGISMDQMKDIGEKLSPVISKMNHAEQNKPDYRNLPYDADTPEQVKELAANLQDQCENLVILGIGGSALGNIALQTALSPYMYNLDKSQRSGPRLFVLDNVDPQQIASFLHWADDKLEKTIFNVISKSGRTTETVAQFMLVRHLLRQKLGEDGYKERVVITTDVSKAGALLQIAEQEKLSYLEIPSGVGGRFSVLSAVGLFSAAMCGIDIDLLLAGARDMDTRVCSEKPLKNPAAIIAAINYYFYNHGKKISVMMPYSYQLKDLADWYRQLWAESLGKAEDLKETEVHVGPTPVKALGVTDQHSQIQLYREGPNDKLFTFLQVNNFDTDRQIGPAPDSTPELQFLAGKHLSTLLNDEKKATEYALLESKRPCLTVLFDRVNAYTVGQFIYLYEVATSFAGALFGINPYDQPAVELGKEATFALIGKAGDEYVDFARKIHSATDIDKAYLV